MEEETVFEPWDIDLEQGLLGAIIIDNRLIDVAAGLLVPEDFYDPLHQRLFEMATYLLTEGAVTPPILNAVMKMDPGLIAVGGMRYLVRLVTAAPTMPPIKEYAKILKDFAARRAILKLSSDMADAASRPPSEIPTAVIADKSADALAAAMSGSKEAARRRPVRAADAALSMLRRIEEQAVAETPHGVSTGLERIDREMILLPGKLWIVAGRPGMGKSILATNIARAASENVPVDYLSGEMDNDELSARICCDIDFDRCEPEKLQPMAYGEFISLKANAATQTRCAEATLKLHDMALDFFDVPGMAIEWIEGLCRRRSREKPGHRIVIIDHLQLVTWEGLRRGGNRMEEQTEITKRLKSLAKELGITLIALSQLSRAVEGRDDKHPILSDLREGGSIEQDADVVVAIMRPLIYARQKIQAAKNADQRHEATLAYDAAVGVLEAAFLKNRGGRTTDYFDLFIDEKASAVRGSKPEADVEQMLL